ncbi:MAG: signal peptidase I [Oscillospiraceae bacterium]|nr:signal peptidase I [Oscillospiraceae bacterium]
MEDRQPAPEEKAKDTAPEEKIKDASPEKKEKDPKGNAYDWIESLVTAIVACIIIFLFLFRVVNVQGTSMVPTLRESDKIVISRLARNYKYGDIVVLTKIAFDDESIVKRVIATEGQTIDIDFDEGIVTVDGVVLQEPYIAEKTRRQMDFHGPVTVPEGCIFCMGDNRNASTDSRRSTIGMIDTRCVLGRVVLRLWPLDKIGTVK